MASSVNKVILIGNLGKDPKISNLNSGDRVVSFTLATSDSWKDKNSGERKEKTEWHNIVVYNEGIGRIVEQYCKKGTIVITLKSAKNHTVEFSVGDEGIGIPKEELLDIFDPFTVSSKTKTQAGGRGIWLTLCKKVITAHGGTINANNKNKGSLFRVILPK